ncbi:MAG TPA: SnoaL-like domain-containing protein [Propionibacterium sp.]|nr:SnoaL-like domain-containing protein [Propionibacterium sp.]
MDKPTAKAPHQVTDDTGVNSLAVLERLAAESEIRRLVAAGQWKRDFGTNGMPVSHWESSMSGPTSPCGLDPSEEEPSEQAHCWTGEGLSDSFSGYERVSREERSDFGVSRDQWMPKMMHFLTNEQIYVESSRTARGRWYSWEAATVLLENELVPIWIAGRYEF